MSERHSALRYRLSAPSTDLNRWQLHIHDVDVWATVWLTTEQLLELQALIAEKLGAPALDS
jgi:hypothetical protein